MNSKSLKILIAGTAFLAILVTAGIVFFYPRALQSRQEVPLAEWTAPESVQSWNNLTPETPLSSGSQPGDEDPFVVVSEPLPPVAAAPVPAEQPPAPAPAVQPAPAPGREISRPAAPAPAVGTPQTPVQAKPVPTVKVTEFWIQAAAYTDRYAAERSSQTLGAQNLNSVLFTGQTDKGTVYRVRLGPYKNRQEAEKYLGWVKALKDFSGAYITQATALREVR